ncbi:MAG: hypothetical protein AAFS10_06630 [Myxococcota bacterium]
MSRSTSADPEPRALSRDELRQILFACLRPATRIAEALELSLADLRELIELAYFHRALRSGKRKGAIKTLFGIGATKTAELSHQLKQHFLAPERHHTLPRQVLALLSAGPMSRAQIGKALADISDTELDVALEQLDAEDRLRHIRGRTLRYAASRNVQRLSLVPWLARIDGLNTLMDHINLAIDARFDRHDDRALVRNIAFQVAPEDVEALQAFYEEQLMPTLIALDDKAQRDPNPITFKLSILWAPTDET